MKRIAYILTLFLLSTACKKEDNTTIPANNNPCGNTVENIAGIYKINSFESKEETDTFYYDFTSTHIAQCNYDDLIILKSNKLAEYKDEGTTCTPPENIPVTDWNIFANGDSIVINSDILHNSPPRIEERYKISEYDCNKLVISRTEINPFNNKTFLTRIKFIKQ